MKIIFGPMICARCQLGIYGASSASLSTFGKNSSFNGPPGTYRLQWNRYHCVPVQVTLALGINRDCMGLGFEQAAN